MKEENIEKTSVEEKDLTAMLQESLEINREILKSVKFIKKYFHWRAIWNIVKVAILVLVVIFGAISVGTAVDYFKGYTSSIESYSNQLNQLNNLKNLVDIDKL